MPLPTFTRGASPGGRSSRRPSRARSASRTRPTGRPEIFMGGISWTSQRYFVFGGLVVGSRTLINEAIRRSFRTCTGIRAQP